VSWWFFPSALNRPGQPLNPFATAVALRPWAYATRRAESLQAAQSILLEGVERLPAVSIFHYNLACYECQLGQLEVAKARLAHAFKLDPSWRLAALDDEDLRPVWDSLGK
jgi:hypothetical protein